MTNAPVLDADGVHRTLRRLAHEIVEANQGVDGLVLVGIEGGGAALAQRLADEIEGFEGRRPATGSLEKLTAGARLSDPDVSRDGRIVAIEAAPERLLEVHAHDAIELARIAYHIGNRHVPIQIGDGFVRLLPDHVLQAMIERLGGHVHEVSVGFQPESGAYGHSHVHHQHDDQGHGGRIHVFDPRHGESA